MNHTTMLKRWAIALAMPLMLAACSNDGTTNNTNNNNANATGSTTVTGQAIAGAVDGSLTVYHHGATIANATVTGGNFSVDITNDDIGHPLEFVVTGSYRDEVSGNTVTLTAANPLALYVPDGAFVANASSNNAPITPSTTIIRQMVSNGKTIAQAEAAFQAAFGFKPSLSAKPFDPYTTTTITNQTAADKEAAFRVGMMSQLGSNLGLSATDLAELPSKLANDLADGQFDGMAAGNPVAFGSGVNLSDMHTQMPLGNRLSIALAKFAGSAANSAKLAAPAMGRPPIVADASGTTKSVMLANGTTQIDVTLDVPTMATTVPPFQAGFRSNAKVSHTVTLTNGGNPVDITAPGALVSGISIHPWMYMFSGHGHPTPVATTVDTTQAAQGKYTIDVYYVMATAMMMNGAESPMGQWDLDIQLTDASQVGAPVAHSHFFPKVMMAMGNDLLMARGSNANDTWTNMKGTVPREYRIWLQSITANGIGSHDLTVFSSTQTMSAMMMGSMMHPIFPAVFAGQTHPSINTVTMRVSTDGGTTWQAMTDDRNGGYSIAGLPGLTTAAAATLDFEFTVNGNLMQTAAKGNLQLKFTAP